MVRQICIEGSDGSGKSAVVAQLTKWLNDNGIKAISTRNPGATLLGQELRRIIADQKLGADGQTRALLFAADNSAYISAVLKPKMEAGYWIVADRNNFISSLAYQVADGCSLDILKKIHEATYPFDQIPKIDFLFVLSASYDVVKRRREVRSSVEKAEYYEKQMASEEYFYRVSNAYNSLLDCYSEYLCRFIRTDSLGNPYVVHIDADKPLSEVLFDIQKVIIDYIDCNIDHSKAQI